MVYRRDGEQVRITFIYTADSDLAKVPKDEVYKKYFEVPVAALELEDCTERIRKIAYHAGQLTHAALHLMVAELGIKQEFVKQADKTDKIYFYHNYYTLPIVFDNYGYRSRMRQFDILHPITRPASLQIYNSTKRRKSSLRSSLYPRSINPRTEEEKLYFENISQITEGCLALLNSKPELSERAKWQYIGFHPHWTDGALIKRDNERRKRREAEHRKQERLEKKRQAAIAKGQTPATDSKTIVRGRAVPGVFMNVQMRSQLEIRFAAHLEKQGIRWQYEPERLGEANYLIDFYLPDKKCWVEVKGKFEPRDELVLPEIAEVLEKRGEKLFVYTQRDAFIIEGKAFKRLIHEDFWEIIS